MSSPGLPIVNDLSDVSDELQLESFGYKQGSSTGREKKPD